jgi:hypothetical protein
MDVAAFDGAAFDGAAAGATAPPRDVPTDLEGDWDADEADDSPDPDWALWEED